MPFSRRERMVPPSKMPTISARSGRLQRRVGRVHSYDTAFQWPKQQLSGIEPRSGLGARRGGRKAGACAQRCLRPLRRAVALLTASLAGTQGAFRTARRSCHLACQLPTARRAVRDRPLGTHSSCGSIASVSACAFQGPSTICCPIEVDGGQPSAATTLVLQAQDQ